MPYTVALPDGRTVEFPDSVSKEKAAEIIRQQLGISLPGPKESTLLGEVVRGAKQLGSTTRTGIEAIISPEEAARAGVERGQRIAEEAGAGPSFAALRKVYEEQGLLPAVGELASQVPRAVAGQLPQLAVMAGGAKAGAMAGAAAAPLLGPAAPFAPVVGGVLGAGATLLPQFFGANVERQAAEQIERGEPVDIDRARAAAAAAGQAGIEAGGTALVLGKRVVKGILGITDDAGLATAKARADLVKAASRSTLGAAGRGAAVGLAEVPVEVAQAVIERAQAGLDVLSPEAFVEYGENAYLAGLVGPTLGAATRVTAPGAAREKLAAEDRIKAAEEKRAARAAEAAEKAKPEYALKLETDYQAAVARMKELQAAVPKKPGKDALPEERMAYEEAKAARDKHLKEVLQPLAAEYVPRKAEIAQLKERQRVEGLTPLEYQLEQTETAPIKGIRPGKAPVPVEDTEIFPTIKQSAAEAYAKERVELANEQVFANAQDVKDQPSAYVPYLMQDPAMAQRLVATQAQIPGLKPRENAATLALLKTRISQYLEQEAAALAAERPDLAPARKEVDTFAPWKQAIEAEERLREEEAMAVEPVRKEEAVIDTAAEQRAQAQAATRKDYLDAIDAYQAARGTPEAPAALQRLLNARRAYEGVAGGRPIGTETLPPSPISEETEAQLDRALTEIAGEAPVTPEALEQRIETLADARKRGIARVSENASELAQYDRLTRYMGTPQGLTQVARTPEMAEAAERRKTPLLERAQQARNEAIAAAIQEIRLQRDLSGLVPLDKTDAELQTEFAAKLQSALTSAQKGKGRVNEEQRQRAIADQLQRVNARIQALEGGDRAGRLLGYASAFRTAPERKGELNNLYKAYRNLTTQQGLTPQAAQLNRTLQNLVDFYTIGGGAAKPRITAAGPRQARRELVLGERTFTGYEPTVEGTEVRYDKPRKIAEYRATPEDQALVEQMRTRELAELNEAADRQYTPETSERVKQQIFDELRQRLDALERPATQEEVARAKAEAPAVDEDTGDLFAAATERAKEEFQTAVARRTAARSELGRAMAGMRGKSAVMDQAQRLAEKFGKDLGLQGTYAEARKRLTAAQRARLAAETEAEAKGQEALLALADDAKMAQQDAEAISRSARNTVEAIATRLAAEKETPAVEVRTPPRAMEILRKIVALQALIGGGRPQDIDAAKQGLTAFSPTRFILRPSKLEVSERDVGSVQEALDQATRAAKEGETWASRIEQVQAHMATLEKYLSRREAQGRLLPEAELMAKQWYRKLAEHEAALRRPTYGAGQLTPAEIRKYTQYRLQLAQTEYDRIKTQIDGLHRQLLDTEVAVAKREADRITAQLNALTKRIERREGADLAEQEMSVLVQQHKDALQRLEEAKKVFEERKKAESVPFTRKSPVSALAQWLKGAEGRFAESVQRFKDKQKALELQFATPETRTGEAPVTTAAQRRAEIEQEKAATAREATGAFMPVPQTLQDQLEGALKAQSKLKKRGSKKQRAAIAQRIQEIRSQLSGLGRYGQEYYDTTVAEFEAQDEAEAREAGKEETTRAGRRKAAKEIFGVQRTVAKTGKVPEEPDATKLDNIIKNNRQAFEMAVAQGFKSTAIRPQKRGKSATPERLMRTPLEGIAYRLRQEIVEKMAAPQTKQQKQELNKLRNELYGLEEAINTPPVTVEERRRTARAVWAKLPKDMRNSVVDKFKGRTESGGVSTDFFDRFADALETTVIRERLGQPLSQAPVTIATAKELAPIQAETEKRVAATLKATEELRNKYYEQKEKELADKAQLKGAIDAATQKQIEKEANEFADKVIERLKEEEARAATQRRKPSLDEDDIELSRGPTANPSTTASLRTELGKVFPDLGRVQIYDSVDALVAANPQYEGQIPSDARGFVDTAGNKAFLIAENVNKGDGLGVLLHEVGAHIGLKNALGEAQYNTLVNAVKSWEKKADGSVESRVAQAARARVEAAETKASQVNDELLAYAIEEAVNAGVKPAETKGVLGQWLSQIATLFRKALEKFGVAPEKLDAQGLVDLAFGAAQIEMAPKVPQVSRRQFLRGAGAALGAMKLPPLPKEAQLDALETAWNASMDAARTWFNTAEAAAKTPTLKAIVDANNIFDIDNSAVAETLYEQGLEDLYNHLYYESYGPMGTEEEFRANLRSYLEDKGVNAVAELQQALKNMYQNVLKEVKGTQKPEVGELFFTYAGEKSGVAPDALRKAKDMQIKGAEPEKIWNDTGWFQGPDKKWRYEIDDSKADFDGIESVFRTGVAAGDTEVKTTLGAVMKHAELYKLYPELEGVPVTMYEDANSSLYGSFDGKEIKLNVAKPDPEGTLIHELQHYIQDKEGFGRGGNTTGQYLRAFRKNVMESVRATYARKAEDADTESDKKFYANRVKAMDAALAAVMQDRAEKAPKLLAARQAYNTAAKKHRAALDARHTAFDKYHKDLNEEFEALKKERDDLYEEARRLRKANPLSREAKLIDAKTDELIAKQRAVIDRMALRPDTSALEAAVQAAATERKDAHARLVELRTDTKDELKNKITKAVADAIGPDALFTKFIKLSVSEVAYQNLMGEVEARDVSERLPLSEAERQATRPYSSQPQRREEILFSRNLPTASRVANQIVGEQKGWFQKIKDNLLGVGGRMQFVDMRYTLEEALKRGGVAEDKALQAMYYVRAYDQRMHMVSQAYQSGAPVKREITRRDGEKEYIIESAPGANISEAARILTSKPVVKAAGSADAANKLVTLYMSAIRGENVGFDKLNFGRTWAQTEIQRLDNELKKPTLEATERTNLQKRKARLEERLDTLPTEQDILAAKAEIEADRVLKDAFDKVREIYNEYNRNLIEFAVQSGAISREEANKLLKNNDYIPYYRMRGGAAELVIGNETPIRIGNLKDNPDLRELLGGDEPIVDFLTSSMQNTAMLLDMSMRNLATKNAMFELRDVGLARITKSPKGGAPANTITFKRDGEEYYAVVDTDALGIDSELVVKSMAGISTLVPGFIRAMGIPARYLRRLIVASPVYWAKSLFRDTTAATLTSGANIVPVLGALRQIGKTETLERRGVTGGQVFSGMPEDTQRILKEMQAGKISLTNGMAWFEAKSAQIDAITRQNQYNSYIEQGLSELEATMMAMESMNFSRRGLSPAVHWLNTMIPFFNSQIQGLDVLYRSFTGKMPLNEKLGIKRKLWLRGSMIFGMSMAYAAMMQDDEAYKNASPEDKYGNWFVRLPGVKEPLRLPIPFELGYVFKALPEALVNIMVNEKGGEEAFKALKHFIKQMIPGASNYFLPQAIKPALEAAANYSIYTERDIESVQEQEKEPWRRYRDSTTEVAKDLGKLTNFSPVMMEYLVRGYTGSLGMALLQALSFTYPKGEVEKAPKRLSEMPVIGSLFQPNDARGIIDATFRRVKEIESAQKTYDDILKEGNLAAATEYAKRKAEELSLTSVAGNFREMIGELTAQAKEIQAARGLSGEQKRRLLDQIRQQQIRIATSARQIFDKSTRQAVLA